jgi:hypothetical protein
VATIADTTATPSPPFSITAAELFRFNPPMPTNGFYFFCLFDLSSIHQFSPNPNKKAVSNRGNGYMNNCRR